MLNQKPATEPLAIKDRHLIGAVIRKSASSEIEAGLFEYGAGRAQA